MNKQSYLSESGDVLPFVHWMAQHLRVESRLGHGYERPRVARLEFGNLGDALEKYEWPFAFNGARDHQRYKGSTFEENARVLSELQGRLREALDAQPEADRAVMEAAVDVVRWGGVAPHNEAWLRANEQGLALRLRGVKASIERDDDEVGCDKDLRFNAGMTKVYSLLIDGFIIYDSRVAAALAWFIVQWMRETARESLPPSLRFPCMVAKEAATSTRRKLRNPMTGSSGFPLLGSRPHVHVKWNLRASWIVEALLQTASGTAFTPDREGSRKLEAALFMWGYDVTEADSAVRCGVRDRVVHAANLGTSSREPTRAPFNNAE